MKQLSLRDSLEPWLTNIILTAVAVCPTIETFTVVLGVGHVFKELNEDNILIGATEWLFRLLALVLLGLFMLFGILLNLLVV